MKRLLSLPAPASPVTSYSHEQEEMKQKLISTSKTSDFAKSIIRDYKPLKTNPIFTDKIGE